MYTGVGRHRSGCFAIPCGGPGSGRVAKGWDVSATPNGTIVLVLLATGSRGASVAWDFISSGFVVTCQTCSPSSDLRRVVPGDRAAVLKAVVEFTASKVCQDLDTGRLSAITVASVAPEEAGRRSPRFTQERTRHKPSSLVSRLPCVRRPTREVGMMVEQRDFKQLMVGDQARALQNMFFAETCVQNPRLVCCGWHCGYWPHGRGITMCCVCVCFSL